MIKLLILSFLILFITGCKKKKSKNEISKLTTPFWHQDIIYQESVLLEKINNNLPSGKLLFTPKKILSVTNFSQDIIYEENKDYVIRGNEIILTKESKIPYLTEKQVLTEEYLEGVDTKRIKRKGGGYLIFSPREKIVIHQISVTYTYEKTIWEAPGYHGNILTHVIDKLKNDSNLELFVFGDSISEGAGASSFFKVKPYISTWPELVKLRLEDEYDININLINKSSGGKDSTWGKEMINSALDEDYKPDLAIIGFGMNDGSKEISMETYKNNIKEIMDVIKAKNNNCDIILLGTMVANPLALVQGKDQIKYSIVLNELAEEYNGVIVVNIGKMHLEMLKVKKYIDLTSNNVNHPNDFLTCIYAMNILDTLIKF